MTRNKKTIFRIFNLIEFLLPQKLQSSVQYSINGVIFSAPPSSRIHKKQLNMQI